MIRALFYHFIVEMTQSKSMKLPKEIPVSGRENSLKEADITTQPLVNNTVKAISVLVKLLCWAAGDFRS